jgi:LPS sulfotransferase NodH
MQGVSSKQESNSGTNSARPVPFVILATQRTGSNWLMSMLDAHPAVAAYDEMLLAGAADGSMWGRDDLERFETYYVRLRKRDGRLARTVWSVRYLNRLYAGRPDTESVGMKLMYDQLWRNPWMWLYMIGHRFRVVHLVRANLLDVTLSVETMKARSQPHAWQGQVVEKTAVTLDPRTIVPTLRKLEFRVQTAKRLLALLPLNHLEVSYEQMMVNPILLGDIFAFLGVPAQPDTSAPISKFKKLNAASKADLIENYAEIERALRGTHFERFLDGDSR